MNENRRAIRTDRLVAFPHIDENMWVIERRQRANTHELLDADAYARDPWLVMETRNAVDVHNTFPSRQRSSMTQVGRRSVKSNAHDRTQAISIPAQGSDDQLAYWPRILA
jgi:hypothetical protein